MMDEVKEKQETPSFKLERMLDALTFNQLRFLTERQYCGSDKEAAEAIGLKADTIYQWKHKGVPIDETLKLIEFDGLITARNIRRRSLVKAMMTKVAGLDSNDDPVRQKVATEIIEWEMGKATNRTEVGGPDGEPIQVEDVNETRQRLLESVQKIVGEDGPGSEEEMVH